MNYLDLATEAKRSKKFSLAIRYYQKELKESGPTIKVLQSAAKTYYLNNQKPLSVKFNLAAIHLYLHEEFEKFRQGDKKIRFCLDDIPANYANQYPHMIGDLLYYYTEQLKHLAHSYIDNDGMYRREPKLKQFAEIYYAKMIGDDSEEVTDKQLKEVENKQYLPVAYELVQKEIKWSEIDNPDVLELYINKTS